MIYSSLIDEKILTNKYSSRYGRKVEKIIIHHMAGKMTAQACARYFRDTTRDVSSNYTIGYDGSLVLCVPEDYRAWTTGSWEVDSRGVTIEVSNIAYGGDWKVSDASLKTLIALVADIAKRHKLGRVTYTGNQSGMLWKHEWFANTNCPGPYLGSKFGHIAASANAMLNIKPSLPQTASKSLGLYKITTGALNIRASADGKSRVVGQIRDRGIYTIVEIKNGWGKLKSGAGWIHLSYAEKVSSTNTPKKSINAIAKEVISGKWGNGESRKKKLTQAGYDYYTVQTEVNKLL